MNTAARKEPIYNRIAGELRTSIARQFRPGDMLPSEHQLANRYAIHRNTVRQAMDVLAREGLVRRHPGQGTVVLDRKAVGEFAVVLRPQILNTDAHPYYTFVTGLIIKLLQERNLHWQVRLHVGKFTETEQEFPATLDLLAPDVLRNLRGVFTFHSLGKLGSLLAAANVPIIGLHYWESPRVWFDILALYTLGLAHLREVGCKTVGAIWAAFSEQHHHTNEELFRRATAACGFEVRPEWVRTSVQPRVTEQEGYELMTKLWKDRPRPDGILVPDDVVCRGVLRAAMQLGVEFPRDVRLVTQASRGIALNYHKPVSRVEYDPTEQVRLAVDMMMTLVEGRLALRSPPASAGRDEGGKPTPVAIDLPGVLIKGETT